MHGADPVDEWYKEINKYKWTDSRSTIMDTEHFTQIVWKSTTHLGVGIAINENQNVYVVACYSPPGNLLNMYSDNVLPKQKPSISENETKMNILSRFTNKNEPNQFTFFQLDFLNSHNRYRNMHSISALNLNEKLCEYAFKKANVSLI